MKKTIRPLIGIGIALASYCPWISFADQNWDGDNPAGNMSYNNNWYGDNQPGWGFGNGNLVFNYRNNVSQTSLYYDYGDWKQTNDIIWETTFGAGLTWDGNAQGLDFNQRLRNLSAQTQVIGSSMKLSGAKNGASVIELNPINGNLTINGTIYNDNSVDYEVFGNNAKTLTINSTLGVGATPANVSFTVKENSTVVIGAAQTYAGGTFVNAGTIVASNSSALGAGTVTLNGGTLNTSVNLSNAITLNNTANTIAPNGTYQILSGQLSGTGGFTVANGGGTPGLALSNPANNFAGNVTLNNGTFLRLDASEVLPNTATVTINAGGNLRLDVIGGGTETVAGLSGGGDIWVPTSNNAMHTLTVGAGNTTSSFSGAIGQSSQNNAFLNLVKTGSGTLTLSGANLYTGGTTVSEGTLQIGNGVGTAGVLPGNASIAAAGSLKFNYGSSGVVYGGQLSATGALIVTGGSNDLQLSGNNSSFTGAVTVDGSHLRMRNDNALGGSNAITLTNGGGISVYSYVSSHNIKAGSLASTDSTTWIRLGSGSNNGLIVGGDNTSTTFAGRIRNDVSGTGFVTKTGTGTLTLSGNNDYGGVTTVNGGTLKIGNKNALGAFQVGRPVTQVLVNSSGAVDFNGINDAVYGYTIAGTGVGGTGALVNTGSNIGTGIAQTSNIKLSANATIGGTGNWALLTNGHGATSLNLNGFTMTKAGANTVALATTTTTAGTLAVAAGTLQLGVTDNASTGVNGAASTFTLDNTAGVSLSVIRSSSVGSLSGGGTTGGNVSIASGVTLTAGALNTPSASYGGVISGTNGNFTKNGTGTLTITGVNTYTGSTTVSAGTLEVGGGGVLDNGSYGGAISITGTLKVNSTAAQTLYGILSGGGALVKDNSGTLTLTGQNTYNGGTVVNGGTLVLNAPSSLWETGIITGTATVNNGGTLQISTGFNTKSTDTINVNGGGSLNFSAAGGTSGANSTYLGTINLSSASGTAATVSGPGDVRMGFNANGTITSTGAAVANTYSSNLLLVNGSGRIVTIDTAAGNTLNFTGLIRDLDGGIYAGTPLYKTGAGTLVLSGANSYDGNTIIRAGTIIARANTAVGDTGTVTLNDGSTGANNTSLMIDTSGSSVTISRSITVANQGSGISTIGSSAMGASNQAIFTGAINLSNKDVTLSAATGGDRTQISGGIGGTGNVTITTAGTGKILFITGANAYSGSTTVSASSILQLSDGTSTSTSFIPDTSLLTVNGTMNLAKGNNSETFGALAGTGTIQGHPGVASRASAIIMGNGGGSDTFSGLLSNGGASGSTLAVTKTGTGTQTLATANTYTGVTTVNGGVLRLDHATALPGGISGGSGSPLTLSGGVVGLGTGNFTRGTGTGATQVQWSGSGGFAAYGGDRSVNLGGGGTATWNTGSFVPTGSALILGAADSANLIDFQNPINFGGEARTVQVDNGPADIDAKLSGLLSGSGGGLTKSGAGTLQLIQATAYTGPTAVTGGTLLLDGSTAAVTSSSGVAIGNGAILKLDNSVNVLDRLNNTGTVAMSGGTLNFAHPGSEPIYSETTGALSVTSGANTILASQAASGNISLLTFASLNISGGSLNFSGTGIGLTTQNQIKFTTPPTLNGSGLIASATLNGNANVTYSLNDGVVPAVASATIGIQGGVIPNGYISTVSIGNVGSSGPMLLATPTTTINTLTQNYNGPETGTVDMAGGGTLRVATVTIESGNSALTFGTAPGSGTLMARDPGSDLKLANLSSATLTVNAVIADNLSASTLTKTGSGTLVLAGAATYSGATAVQEGTLLLAGGANRLPTGTLLTLGAGTTSGILKLDGNNQWLGGLTTSGSGDNNRVVNDNADPATLTLGGNSTFAGVLGGSTVNENNFALTSSGSPTLTGSNTFTGEVTIGTNASLTVPVIATSGPQPLGQAASAIVFQGNSDFGSTLVYSGASVSAEFGETHRGLNMQPGKGGTVSVTDAADVLTVNGALSGTSNFTKAGAGTLALTASDSWSGDGNVTGGTLVIGPASGIGSNSISGGTWDIASGGTLRISTTGALESSTLTRNGTFNLDAGTLRTNTIAGTGAFNWGAATITPLGNLVEGSVDRTDPDGAPSGPVVREGNILEVSGSLATSAGSVLDLGGLTLNDGLRYNQFRVANTLTLGSLGVLNININPYFFRPTSPNSVTTGDWGTLVLAYADTISGQFASITGIGTDGIGWDNLGVTTSPVDPENDLLLNQYKIEYRTGYGPLAGGDAILFHYKVAGTVPEPASAGLLVAGALLLRALRRRK